MAGTAPLELPPARVLVVTQDDAVKSLINNLMLHKRVRAGVTESPESATHFLASNPSPDMVILDLDLPEARALTFLRQVRRRDSLDTLPVLVLTSFPDPALIRRALDAGANRYITKIFMDKNLFTAIHETLSQFPPESAQQTAPLRQTGALS